MFILFRLGFEPVKALTAVLEKTTASTLPSQLHELFIKKN